MYELKNITKEADWQHTDISDRPREAEFAMIYTTDSEKRDSKSL